MKNALLTLLLTAGMAGLAPAATLVNYVAGGDPNQAPDTASGEDIWTCAFTGGSGSGFYAPANSTTNMWDIYTYGNPAGTATMTYNFQGNGVLGAGQTVSLTYAHNFAINAGNMIGIQLLDAGSNVQTEFIFVGGGPNGFAYGDTSTGFAAGNLLPTGKQYDANDPFKVSFTITSTNTYSGTASATATNSSSGAWTGAYTNPITAIRVVNLQAGDTSDQYSNNLVVSVPEPASLTMLALGGVAGGLMLRRRRK